MTNERIIESNATYLGDGVYVARADHDPNMVELFLHNGMHKGDTIFLEPDVFEALLKWYSSVNGVKIRVEK